MCNTDIMVATIQMVATVTKWAKRQVLKFSKYIVYLWDCLGHNYVKEFLLDVSIVFCAGRIKSIAEKSKKLFLHLTVVIHSNSQQIP
jgi:hypothetical protein